MKKVSLLLFAALPLALTIGCQKEVATTANRNPSTLAGPPPCTGNATAVLATPSFAIAPTAPVVNTLANITIGVGFDKAGYDQGTYTLFITPPAGVQAPVSGAQGVTVASNPSISVGYTPTVVGTYSYKLQYIASSPRQCIGGTVYAASGTSIEGTFEVKPACTQPVDLSIVSSDGVAVVGQPGFYDFTLTITVKTCGDGAGLTYKTQGGATAGGVYGASIVTSDIPVLLDLNKNFVFSKTEAITGTKVYTVVYRRAAASGCGQEVSGAWSSVETGSTGFHDEDGPATACVQ